MTMYGPMVNVVLPSHHVALLWLKKKHTYALKTSRLNPLHAHNDIGTLVTTTLRKR